MPGHSCPSTLATGFGGGKSTSGGLAPWAVVLVAPLTAMAAEGMPASTAPRLTPTVGWVQWVFALLVVFGALAAFFLLLRRFGMGAGLASRHLKVLGGVSLGARERVVVVQAGSKQLVLGVSPGRIETLCVLEGEERMQAESQQASSDLKEEDGGFARQLSGLMGHKRANP